MGYYSSMNSFSVRVRRDRIEDFKFLTNPEALLPDSYDAKEFKSREARDKSVLKRYKETLAKYDPKLAKGITESNLYGLFYNFSEGTPMTAIDDDLVEMDLDLDDYYQKHYESELLMSVLAAIVHPFQRFEISETGEDGESYGGRFSNGKVYALQQAMICEDDPEEGTNCFKIWPIDQAPGEYRNLSQMIDAEWVIFVPETLNKEAKTLGIPSVLGIMFESKPHSVYNGKVYFGKAVKECKTGTKTMAVRSPK